MSSRGEQFCPYLRGRKRVSFVSSKNDESFVRRMIKNRLMKNGTDLKIFVGKREFGAHKIVLKDASPVFARMLSRTWLKNDTLKFEDPNTVDPDTFDDFLNYLISDQIVLTLQNVQPLFKTAHFLEVLHLVNLCEKFMIENVSEKNFKEFFKLSTIYSLIKLKISLLGIIAKKYSKFPEGLKVWKFDLEDFADILKHWKNIGYTKYKLNDNYCGRVIAWVKCDEENRKHLFSSLIALLPLHNCSYDYLRDNVANNVWIKELNPEFRVIMNFMLIKNSKNSKNFCFYEI